MPLHTAPEVEYTSKGLGGTYGLPADCWSLGAVLYVMLVARFPEFEQDPTGIPCCQELGGLDRENIPFHLDLSTDYLATTLFHISHPSILQIGALESPTSLLSH